MKERRAYKRAKKCFAINIVAIEGAGKKRTTFDKIKSNPKFYDESGIDFSPAGIKIICSKSLPEDLKVQKKLLIPDKGGLNLIRAHGTIRWFKELNGKYKKYFMIGIRFDDLKKEDKERLTKLWKRYRE